ncbi:MAG: TetR/AcrR family transcriptional regulator [Thermoleophilaceae bacterium]
MTPPATDTRDSILTRAVELASTDGLEGLTIGRLAGELGLSKSGLFGHFGSKEELQLAAVREARRVFTREIVTPALDEEPGAPRLRALCERYFDYLERPAFPGGCFMAAAAAEFDGRPGPVRDAVADATGAWLEGLALEARRAGVEDPERLAFEVHSYALGANTRFQLLGDRDGFALARRALERRLQPP